MGTLFVDRKDLELKLDGSAMAFYVNGEREGTVPIKPLNRIVIKGSVMIDTAVFRRLAENGVTVVFISGKGSRFCGMFHGPLHNNGLLRLNQYQKTETTFPQDFACRMVMQKLTGNLQLLVYARDERPDLRLSLTSSICTIEKVLEKLESATDLASLRGLEGGASAAYFGAFTGMFPPSLEFKKRTRRPPLDPVNAMLSMVYTMIHYETVSEIQQIGLDPTIGYYHQFEYGRDSLACDLVEPRRPIVDRFVWTLFRERDFTVRDFAMNDERPGCYLKKDSRSRFYPIYINWVKEIRPAINADVENLARIISDE